MGGALPPRSSCRAGGPQTGRWQATTFKPPMGALLPGPRVCLAVIVSPGQFRFPDGTRKCLRDGQDLRFRERDAQRRAAVFAGSKTD